MLQPVTVEVADPAEALQESLDAAPGTTRAQILKRAALGGGSLLVGGVAFGGIPSLAFGASASDDAKILNFALLLEYLEAAFYTEAEQKGQLQGEARNFAHVVGGHERAHRDFLKKALGSQAIASPSFDFSDTTSQTDKFIVTAIALEDTGVGAYNGQGANLTKATLAVAAEVVSVEARHAAWIRDIADLSSLVMSKPAGGPAPDAFDPLLTKSQVLQRVNSTGFVK
ncbi:MAG: ferritin-like domain-containing protein [Solirubrobacteraceae bacterium]